MKRLIAILTLFPLAAHAHAFLLKADPAVGATVAAAPSQLALHFSEGVEPAFTTVAVTCGGTAVAVGAPHTAASDTRTLLVALSGITPGTCHVEWHATSVDTHKTEGGFSFTVAKP
jgi:methionine-rich copper-binding protein CopC